VRPRRRRAALTGDGVSIEIGLRQLAGEHEWGLEKRIRGSVEANGGQKWLPTVMPYVAGVGDEGGSGKWAGSLGNVREIREIGCRDAGGASAHER
jgi:hypothetical protein